MCFKNYTQHPGCGHYGETYHNHYTPCLTVFATLSASRGPSSPPLSPPAEFSVPSASTKQKRFFSMSNMLQRSNTSASSSSRRTVSGPEARTSTSSFVPDGLANDVGIPDHELITAASACPGLRIRTQVSKGPGGRVCKECAQWLEYMRSMLDGYDKGRGVRGTPAFNMFLEHTRESRAMMDMLGLLPTPGPAEGTVLGGR
ncbi:hypothetical protein P280DRAFT_465651 [Massarina eburnea CBS 473.64]|uniref:Uncharacterized protein n=1 Tax=Massarina eburnea CBS 473.64 TaxID=1395130 RepID=A0A6A6SGV0_9PLEO|nr:hypothetical protein P280DRAFT_465651 [Massarina eburnea CBS 473.64]